MVGFGGAGTMRWCLRTPNLGETPKTEKGRVVWRRYKKLKGPPFLPDFLIADFAEPFPAKGVITLVAGFEAIRFRAGQRPV